RTRCTRRGERPGAGHVRDFKLGRATYRLGEIESARGDERASLRGLSRASRDRGIGLERLSGGDAFRSVRAGGNTCGYRQSVECRDRADPETERSETAPPGVGR